jgi:S1-C subfamily serine protease
MRGEVGGINSRSYSRSGGHQGFSCAIPIEVEQQVLDTCRARHAHLGVMVQELNQGSTPDALCHFGRGGLSSHWAGPGFDALDMIGTSSERIADASNIGTKLGGRNRYPMEHRVASSAVPTDRVESKGTRL